MAPVHDAARENDVEELARLLDEDPRLLEAEEDDWKRERPLDIACAAGCDEAAWILLERGAAINTMNGLGQTPLMRACRSGRVELVSMLLVRGADPAMVSASGWTALMWASYGEERDGSDHVEVIRRLLGRIPVNGRNETFETALWWACFRGFSERARVLLLEGCADHTLADDQGMTPMDIARRMGRLDCIRVLEEYERELERAFLLSKARAVVDATESISKAPEKVGARTEAEAQRAREVAAPAWLRGRVGRGEALPCVEVVLGLRRRLGWGREEEDEDDEERWAVLHFAMEVLKHDLYVELMEGLRYH